MPETAEYYKSTASQFGTRCTTFRKYTTFNVFRFLIIVVSIFLNIHNRESSNNYKDCCSCYYISLQPKHYGISESSHFDLQHCIPHCTDCNYCSSFFNNTAQRAFNYTMNHREECQLGKYQNTNNKFSWDWQRETGCSKDISVSTLHWFRASYSMISWIAIIFLLIYIFLLILSLYFECVSYQIRAASNSFLFIQTVYNIIFSSICLYLIYIPYQYQSKIINIGNNVRIQCEMNNSDDGNKLNIASGINASVGILLIFIHFTLSCYHLCCCCKKKHNEPDVLYVNWDSINLTSTDDIRRDPVLLPSTSPSIEKITKPKIFWIWVFVGLLVFIYSFAYLVILLWSIISVLQHNLDGIMITIFVLLFSSLDLVAWNLCGVCFAEYK